MPRPPKATPSRSTPRPSTRSQQLSPPGVKPNVVLTLKNHHTTSNRGETSDNDNESVCSSSKSSEIVHSGAVAKDRAEGGSSSNRAPWRHTDELDYFRPSDWSEDKIISHLRSIVFTVPPPVLGKQSFIEIILYDGGDFDKPKRIKVPRGYRVPLMFVAKFQWASLKLVLTSGQREKEWSDYKFDILHLSRLCERFFTEAQKACQRGIVEIPPIKSKAAEIQADPEAMTRRWRCPTFDRALARYNKNWLISREEFLRDFYIEFEDEEYVKDVLKIDWSRWALKGHKGFKLTPDELKIGIDGRMITRGLKKDLDGKWIWVDDYVIKQEEVAAAVVPSEVSLPVVGKHHTPKNDGQSMPPPPPVPSQNGHISPLFNDASPEPTSATVEPTMTPATQAVKAAAMGATSGESGERLSSETSEQRIADESCELQMIQLNSTEKPYSPLNSLPSSATPGIPIDLPSSNIAEPPVDDVDIAKEEFAPSSSAPSLPETTFEIATVVQPSPQPNLPLESQTNSKPSSPQPPPLSPLTIPTIPSLQHYPQSPQRLTPSTASVSEATQPPRSHSSSPISSPKARSKSIELVAETSPLTPLHPETSFIDQGHDFAFGAQMEDYKPGTETLAIDSKLSPTSIDSTPTPSPTIPPVDIAESVDTFPFTKLETPTNGHDADTVDAPTTLPAKEVFVDPACFRQSFVPEEKLPIINGVSEEATHVVPRSSSPWRNDIDVRQHSSASTRPQTPVFLSPLLPPATRSRSGSPDEIPGLGGLSSRRPYTLPLQFVTPTLTARTVTHNSSWHIPELGEEAKDDFPHDSGQLQYPFYSPEVSEKPQGESMEPTVEVELSESIRNGADAAVRENTPAAEENHLSNKGLQSNRATPTVTVPTHSIPQGRKYSHVQGSDYDDDSDMDFGTPVTSPVIIVPGPNMESIDMLPSPVSPSPVPPKKSKSTDPSSTSPQVRQNTPQHRLPHYINTTARASTPSPVSQDGAPTSTPRPMSSHRTEDVRPASDSDVVMKILESVARDHAEKADKAERVLPSNGFASTPASIGSTELHFNQPVVEQTSASVHPQQSFMPTIPLVVKETLSQPLPQSATSMSSSPSPSPFPSTHSMPSTTVRPLSALNGRIFSETTAIGSYAASDSVGSVSRSNAVSSPEVDMDDALQRHQTEKTGGTPIPSLANIQTDGRISRPTPQPIPPLGPTSSNAEISSWELDLNDSSQAVQSQLQTTEYPSVARKRQRDGDGDEEIEEETTFKSQKTGESLSVRGGLVVRKVVSMVRDTLTGLNDLLEIAAERELIPFEKARAANKGKARAVETLSRDESPISSSLPSPVVRSPFFHSLVESSEVTRLNEELLLMKAEMAQLKEQKVRETPVERSDMDTMRTELETLREQLRVLKEGKASETGTSEVQAMRNEIKSLKNEMRSLLSPSNRSSGGPTTPSTPNLSFRLNSHAMSQTIHPLAHLLAVESDTVPSTPTTTSTIEVSQSEGELTRLSQKARVRSDDGPRSNPTHAVSRTPAFFDNIPLPVKSKRKSRMFFSRS